MLGTEFLVQAGAALVAWGLLACVTYIGVVWCFGYHLRWARSVKYAGFFIGLVAVALTVLYVLYPVWASMVTTIVLPALLCVSALHAFLLLLKGCLSMRTQLLVREIRFYTALVFLYVFFLGGAAGIVYLDNPYLTDCFRLSLHYFMYTVVFGIFCLSLCTHSHADEY